MTHEPIAIIETRPIYLLAATRPLSARVVLDFNEENPRGLPVLTGWKIRNWQRAMRSTVSS